MNRKIPDDAFSFYVSLGPTRSYQVVADRFGVSKRGVASYAKRENWQGRLAEHERKAREAADQKALESLEAMNERHLKVLRFIQGRSIEAMKSMSLDTAMEAIRAYTAAVTQERLIRGEPTDRTENVEALLMRDLRLMKPPGKKEWAEAELEPQSERVEPEAKPEAEPGGEDDAESGGVGERDAEPAEIIAEEE